MVRRKYEFQPIREGITALACVALVLAWMAYVDNVSHDTVAGLFESSLILIIAAEAYARD